MNASLAQVRGEDTLGPRNYQQLAKFIYDYSGIKMPPNKVTMLEGRLRRRLRATGLSTFNEYCDFLFKQGGLQNVSIFLIDAVTTNKTDFFREPNHFAYLEQVVLPELKEQGVRRMRAWSAACSNGAEPYTMAMVMAEAAQNNTGCDFSILATDLSTDVLKTAKAGIYPADQLDPVPPHMMAKYVMLPKDKRQTSVRITPALRSKIGFGRLNFMDKTYPVGDPFHMIFCRNVLIYFDKPTQAKVLSRLCDHLVPGG